MIMAMDVDDDRTVLLTPPAKAAATLSDNGLALGQRLGEFEIAGLVGEGGFGIVYLAEDVSLGRQVAVKEYMPSSLASRVDSTQVIVKSQRHEETFKAGLSSFINEARMLARFDHQSVVKVHRFWEANGTAYMVMPYYRGLTLKQELATLSGPAPEAWLKQLMRPILEALEVLHAGSCFHRDIAPDNILLLQDSGLPLLLDFGAARHVIGDFTQNLTVILKPGYAPIEQYAEIASLRQGAWTDLYALAAVLHCALTGKTPPASVSRAMHDDYVPLAAAPCKGGTTLLGDMYSAAFLAAIDHGLGVKPMDRWQTAAEFAEALGVAVSLGSAAASSERMANDARANAAAVQSPKRQDAASEKTVAGQRGVLGTRTTSTLASTGASGASGHQQTQRLRRGKWIAASIAACVVLGGGAAFLAVKGKSTQQGEQPTLSSATGPATSAPSAAASADVRANDPANTETGTGTNAGTRSAAHIDATARPLAPFSITNEFSRIAALGDASINVAAAPQSHRVRIGHDRLGLTLQSSNDGYAYVFLVDPAGQYAMLFPNQLDEDNHIAANTSVSLPHANWPMVAGPPSGLAHFLVIVSAQPRNFLALGLSAAGGVFANLPESAIASAALRRTTSVSPFAGQVTCTGSQGCDQRFGASTFDMEIVK